PSFRQHTQIVLVKRDVERRRVSMQERERRRRVLGAPSVVVGIGEAVGFGRELRSGWHYPRAGFDVLSSEAKGVAVRSAGFELDQPLSGVVEVNVFPIVHQIVWTVD